MSLRVRTGIGAVDPTARIVIDLCEDRHTRTSFQGFSSFNARMNLAGDDMPTPGIVRSPVQTVLPLGHR
jgi:hypothetical protein